MCPLAHRLDHQSGKDLALMNLGKCLLAAFHSHWNDLDGTEVYVPLHNHHHLFRFDLPNLGGSKNH